MRRVAVFSFGQALAAVLVFGFLGATNPAVAADPSSAKQAAAYFEQGTRLFKKHRYEQAAEKFMRAYEIAPHGAALYNAARAWEEAGDEERAADGYEKAIATGQLSDSQRNEADKRLSNLQSRLGKLVFDEADDVTVSVGRLHNEAVPTAAFFKPGDYTAVFHYPNGRTASQTITVGAGVIVHVTAPEEPGPESEQQSEEATDETSSGGNTLAWVTLGVAGLATGGAVVFGLRALDARDEFEASGYTSQDAHDRAAKYRTWANVSWATAGVFAASGAALLIWGGSGTENKDHDSSSARSSARVQVSPAMNGAVLSGRF